MLTLKMATMSKIPYVRCLSELQLFAQRVDGGDADELLVGKMVDLVLCGLLHLPDGIGHFIALYQ
jgi:hypothetical protein